MAHNIALNTVTGRHMAYTAGSLPWHSLGQNVAEARTWAEAIKLAELDWTVLEAPLYTKWTVSGDKKVEGWKAVVRADTKETLGIHGPDYQIFQNEQAFTFADDLLEGGARFESAGGLGKGEKIWCLARIPQADFAVGSGDKHEMYLLVATSHDGSMAFTATATSVRVVCNNTLTAALGRSNAAADGKLKVRHTTNGNARLSQAQKLIAGTVQTAESLRIKLNQLAKVRMTRESMTEVFDRLFPKSADPAVSQVRRDNMLSEILASYEVCDRNAFPEQRGTAYALLNAVTDYTDHLRGTARRDQSKTVDASRAESALFGSGSKLKADALNVIYQTVGAGESFDGDGNGLLDAIIGGSN